MAVVQKRYWVAFGLLIVAIAYQHVLSRESDLLSEQAELQGIPYQVGSWRGLDQPMEQRILNVLRLDAYIQRKYVNKDNRILWLYVGYYRNQRQGKGIHSPKHCYPGAGWSVVGRGIESIPLDAGNHESLTVNRLVFQKDEAKQVVLYWFQSGDRIMHSEYTQRIYLVLDAIRFNRTDGALVKISTPLIGDLSETLEYQRGFIRRIYPSLERSISGDRRL